MTSTEWFGQAFSSQFTVGKPNNVIFNRLGDQISVVRVCSPPQQPLGFSKLDYTINFNGSMKTGSFSDTDFSTFSLYNCKRKLDNIGYFAPTCSPGDQVLSNSQQQCSPDILNGMAKNINMLCLKAEHPSLQVLLHGDVLGGVTLHTISQYDYLPLAQRTALAKTCPPS